MTPRTICLIAVALLALPKPGLLAAEIPTPKPGRLAAGDADATATASAITREATLPNGADIGRPLPLAAHWNTGHYSRARGMDGAFQVSLVEEGHHVLPGFHLAMPPQDGFDAAYYETGIKRAAELGLPITFVATQWERILTADKRWFDLPPERNSNALDLKGAVQKKVSPFGPIEPWREAGRAWTDREVLKELQKRYPDPPLIIFLSNNEHSKLTWKQAEQSKRFVQKYGKGKSDAFKRRVFGEGWIERYRALQDGMRDGLTAPAWKKNGIFVGYEAFGPAHFGRWGGWMEYSLVIKGRVTPWPLAWDGGTPSFYVHNWNPSTDYTVWSPHLEANNWVFMLREAWKLNPRYWWELSIWDGHEPRKDNDMRKVYARRDQEYGPERYRGFVQFGMWLLRPRAVREFRGWTDDRKTMMPYFNEILAAVDRVHESDTLAAFWRKGQLVPNRAHKHPYQQRIPDEYKDVDRWYLLDTTVTPKRPWKLTTEMPVWAIALVLGEQPKRRWLLYAQSPLEAREGVEIMIPGHGTVTVDVTVGGSFYVVDEAGTSAKPVP